MLYQAETWKLTKPPADANIVGSKWIFCTKDAAKNIIQYKACLVAQEFSQAPGVNYFDTFVPIVKLAVIWSVLAMAAPKNLELYQIDIKRAYLNRKLTEHKVIYIQQPPDYHTSGLLKLMCQLHKTLYGLKQSSYQ